MRMVIDALDRTFPARVLERLGAATRRRNMTRPSIQYDAVEPGRVPAAQLKPLIFLVSQMERMETTGAAVLVAACEACRIPIVQSCLRAQVEDELSHARMLRRWLAICGRRAPHPAVVLAWRAAAWMQRDPWIGIRGAEVLAEYWSCEVLDALLPRVEEPTLHRILSEVRKDEDRHCTIALHAIRAMRDKALDRRPLTRVLAPVFERACVAWFRHVFKHLFTRHCGALGLPHEEILERALARLDDGLRRTA